ncbi:MAG: siphovirus Gp157 family protein [Bacteroidales bacterium]|nr:siphovirus Gp157 family protein [Candidatus Equimonas faecalis]
MTLYEIDAEVRELSEQAVDPETGEINEEIFKRLDELQMEREKKIRYVAILYKEAVAMAEMHKAEKAKQAKMQSTEEHLAERYKNYLAYAANGEKYKFAEASIGWRKSETVAYTDIKIVPREYIRYKDPEVDKVGLKAALKTGAEIPGCWIEEKNNVQIR